jgi:hypothetical protein
LVNVLPVYFVRSSLIAGGFKMNDNFELIRGCGNVFRDFGRANAGLEQVTLQSCGGDRTHS